jgi:hypothetical protein
MGDCGAKKLDRNNLPGHRTQSGSRNGQGRDSFPIQPTLIKSPNAAKSFPEIPVPLLKASIESQLTTPVTEQGSKDQPVVAQECRAPPPTAEL